MPVTPSHSSSHRVTRFGACTALAALASIALLALPLAPARAFPGRFDGVPNGTVLRTQWMTAPTTQCLLCHTATSPGTCAAAMTAPCLNAGFGVPYQTSGWTAVLATADLDNDGFTNGQELQDPTGAWAVGMTAPGIAAHVTAPQDAAAHPGLHDADMDHVCWFGRDTNNDFLCTGAGERSASDYDCLDDNPGRHSGAAELCDAADQDCDGAIDEGLAGCDPGIGDCGAGQGQNKDGDCYTRELIDGDRDGYCHSGQDLSDPADWDCADEGEQNGQDDCDEFDPERSPGIAEACLDGLDNDCDGNVDADDGACADYADSDGDGFCPLGADADDDGQCDTEAEAASAGRDCDDGNESFSPNASEACTSGEDEDCDGLLDGRDESCADYVDEDRDGFCAAGRDEDGDFLCDGSGEPSAEGDCDDGLSNVYAGAPENCIDERDNDCDGDADEAGSCVSDEDADDDGYCPLGRDLSDPRDGDCTDRDEDQAVSDCDDGDDNTNPDSVEACADRVDNDCDGLVDLADDDCQRVLDRDGDAYCPEGHDTNGDGDCLDFDEARPIRDCDDDDDERRPRIGESCADGIDNDCNELVDGFDPTCACESHAQCPVSEPCMIGRCIEDVGCRAEPDPSCGEDEDGGATSDPDAAVTRDGGSNDDAGAGGMPAELEDVGCGCRLVGSPDSTRPALLLAAALLAVARLRRRR